MNSSESKEIKFNPEFIELIESGRKTETRRALKVQPEWVESNNPMVSSGWMYEGAAGSLWLSSFPAKENFATALLECEKCPYGEIGDVLRITGTDIHILVESTRIERVQDITEAGAIAEGMGSPITRDCKVPKFMSAWDSIYLNSFPWGSNPWVWVITFKTLEQRPHPCATCPNHGHKACCCEVA